MHAYLRYTLVTFWFVAILGAWSATTTQLQQHSESVTQAKITPPPLVNLDPRFVRIITMGYKGVFDDLINLWMVQILVDTDRLKENREDVRKIARQTMQHEPRIEGFYFLSCVMLFKHMDFSSDCVDFVDAGMKLFPESFRLPMLQGYVYLFELNQPARAAAYYSIAATKKIAPPHIKPLVGRLLKQAGDLSDADLQEILIDVSKDNSDPLWQAILKQKFEEIRSRGVNTDGK
jgi:hypothetical protein